MRSEAFWVLLAFLLRAAFAVLLGERTYQADESGYDALARSVARFGVLGIEGRPQVVPPVAPLFFGLFHHFGHSFVAARLGQAGVSTATALVLGRMTASLTRSARAGLFALAVAAVYPFFIYYSGMLMTETLYLLFIIGGLWALCASLMEKGKSVWIAAAAGLALSLAGLTRTEGVPVSLVLLLAVGVLAALRRYSRRSWALAALCWLLPLAGWAARNKTVCGACALDLHGGMTMLHGTVLFDVDQIDTLDSEQGFRLTSLYREGQRLPELERDRLYRRAALRYISEDPGRTVRQWLHKSLNFWRFYPRIDKRYPDTAMANPGLGARRWVLVAVSLVFEPALILLGFYGLWLLRRRAESLFPLAWLVLATFAGHVLTVSQMRYRLPVMAVLIAAACFAADRRLDLRRKA